MPKPQKSRRALEAIERRGALTVVDGDNGGKVRACLGSSFLQVRGRGRSKPMPIKRLELKSPKQIDAGCLCFTLLLALGCASGPSSIAQSPLPHGISVSGHGEAQGQPDLARVTIGVEARALIANQATEQVNQQMSRVIAAIQQHGVAEADIRTQNFSINFEQQPEPYPPYPRPETGPAPAEPPAPSERAAPAAPSELLPRGFYRVSNTVQVTVRALAKLGTILGATTEAGANNIWGIQFEIEDPSKLEAEARQEAVAQAKARAEQLAQLAGVKLGRVISLGESGSATMPNEGYGYSMQAARADVPVQRGQLTVNQDVQIVFSIE
jgi:uncharacterized protein